jgi:hypothetical protein
MRHPLLRRLVVTAVGLGALFTALVASSISVGAIDPSVFTNNGCPVGNYSCLQAALASPSQPIYYPTPPYMYGYPYHPYYPYYPYPVAYVQPYVYAPQPPPAQAPTTSATIASGRSAATGRQVAIVVGGFTPDETVTASVTGPNGQSLQIGSAPAASDGSVTITLSFPSAGTWQVTVHGQTSGKNVVNTYTVQ